MRAMTMVLVLAAVLVGCKPRPQDAAKPRLLPCRRATGKITIDGKLTEPSWEAAYTLDDFTVAGTCAKPKAATSARLLWDDTHLYLAAVMEDRDITAVLKDHDSHTWTDDVVEIFLKPSDHKHYYYEVHVTPLNTTLDLLIPRRGSGSLGRYTPWESGVKSAVVVKGTLNEWRDKDKGWLVEAAIPLAAFAKDTPKPQLGDRWRFAVCRFNYSVYLDKPEQSSTARLPVADFHRHEAYDYLEFVE